MLFYIIIFIVIGLVVGLITAKEEDAYALYLLIGIGWFFISGPFAILAFVELMIGDTLARKIKGQKSNVDSKNSSSTVTFEITPSQESGFNYENYSNGHLEKTWNEIGLKVPFKYKKSTKKYYSFKEISVSASSLKYLYLTKNQRKVKILGDALVKRTKSKKLASKILINQYNFKQNTAEYAVGYNGYYDW